MSEILTQPTHAELVAAAEANYIAYFAGFAVLPQCEFHRDPELTWFIADGPPGTTVLHTELSPQQVARRIEETLQLLKARARSGWWRVTIACQPADLAHHLQAHGLVKIESRPVMTASLETLGSEVHVPANLRIVRVQDMATLHDWYVASATGFGAPLEAARPYFDAYAAIGFAMDAPFQHYVGYLDGEPVTSSTLLLAAGLAGIYDVSTIPRVRKQGLGRAITLAALLEARARGYRYAMLQSTHQGYNLYRGLGFSDLYVEDNYLWQR